MSLSNFKGDISNLITRYSILQKLGELFTDPETNTALDNGEKYLPVIAYELAFASKNTQDDKFAVSKQGISAIFAAVAEHEGEFVNQVSFSDFLEHLLFTNIFFNIKELYCLKNSHDKNTTNWEWELITHQTLSGLFVATNKFLIIKISLSAETLNILNDIGFDNYISGYPCHKNHRAPQSQYMILSSEPINKNSYLNLEPSDRAEESHIVINNNLLSNIDIEITDAETPVFSYTSNMLSIPDGFLQLNQTSNSDNVTIGTTSQIQSATPTLSSAGISKGGY